MDETHNIKKGRGTKKKKKNQKEEEEDQEILPDYGSFNPFRNKPVNSEARKKVLAKRNKNKNKLYQVNNVSLEKFEDISKREIRRTTKNKVPNYKGFDADVYYKWSPEFTLWINQLQEKAIQKIKMDDEEAEDSRKRFENGKDPSKIRSYKELEGIFDDKLFQNNQQFEINKEDFNQDNNQQVNENNNQDNLESKKKKQRVVLFESSVSDTARPLGQCLRYISNKYRLSVVTFDDIITKIVFFFFFGN